MRNHLRLFLLPWVTESPHFSKALSQLPFACSFDQMAKFWPVRYEQKWYDQFWGCVCKKKSIVLFLPSAVGWNEDPRGGGLLSAMQKVASPGGWHSNKKKHVFWHGGGAWTACPQTLHVRGKNLCYLNHCYLGTWAEIMCGTSGPCP